MAAKVCEFAGQPIGWQEIEAVARHHYTLSLSEPLWQGIAESRAIVDDIVRQQRKTYGINTGLGALSEVTLSHDQLATMSYNTLHSHACGVGDLLSIEQTRAIMCAAVANFSKGKSGIAPEIVRQLMDFLNRAITPCVPANGSVGYLTHMAQIGLALIGVGEVWYQGERQLAADVLAKVGLVPVALGAKDGLSLVNGTPCMTGLTALALADAQQLFDWADIISAMSFEALKGQMDAFDSEVLALKASDGVALVGTRLRALLADSPRLSEHKGWRTQDALSLRSIPQVHGACRDVFHYAQQLVDGELNAATDNPLILGTRQNWRVVSQANPHGESVAMAADMLAVALCEMGTISERRADRLINPLVSELPAFLVAQPGVNSGMMIAQYTAASLCADNKMLAQPAVLDNFVTSALQEDHLSMGTRAAVKLQQVATNTRQILSIEYLFAAQAFDLIGDEQLAGPTRAYWQSLRAQIPMWREDRWMAPDLDKARQLLTQPCALTTE